MHLHSKIQIHLPKYHPWLRSACCGKLGLTYHTRTFSCGKLDTSGVDKNRRIISFFEAPELPVDRENGHLWISWKFNPLCLFTEQERTKLLYRFEHPWEIEHMHEFLKRARTGEWTAVHTQWLKRYTPDAKNANTLHPHHMLSKSRSHTITQYSTVKSSLKSFISEIAPCCTVWKDPSSYEY